MKRKMTTREICESRQFDYNQFASLGFTAQEAYDWKSYGFGWRTAPTWRDAGFSPAAAADWRDATSDKSNPILPSEAAAARKVGETPESYRRNRNRTYPHPMRTR